ncbi:MAG: hypothetical protein IKR11_06310 [Solobacterium sp.]|nr:hypothetical protein [Solobacterium sp.]
MIYKTFIKKMKNKLEEEKKKHKIEDYAFWQNGYKDPEHAEEIAALNQDHAYIQSSALHGDWFQIRFRNFSHAISAEEYFGYANMFGWRYLDSAISREIHHANSTPKPIPDNPSFVMADLSKDLIVRVIPFPEEDPDENALIYRRYGDIALCTYILIGDNGYDYLTLKLPRQVASEMNLTDDYLLERALRNTSMLYPPVLYDNSADAYYCENELTFAEAESHFFPDGFFLSNIRTVNGATALFYPGVMERIAELLEDDFYVVFISEGIIHIVPASHADPAHLQCRLTDVNVNNPSTILSNIIYRYNRAGAKLQPCDKKTRQSICLVS